MQISVRLECIIVLHKACFDGRFESKAMFAMSSVLNQRMYLVALTRNTRCKDSFHCTSSSNQVANVQPLFPTGSECTHAHVPACLVPFQWHGSFKSGGHCTPYLLGRGWTGHHVPSPQQKFVFATKLSVFLANTLRPDLHRL